MASSLDAPKVFISYSWKPVLNKEKTIAFAERMTNDGVNVILDEWNLAEGQDKYQFMEQMVNDPDIKRVLIICNKDYEKKANDKSGGVGTESLIISDKIYRQAEQTKFIPVVFEKNENSEAYVPTFIQSRIYIDLSTGDLYEDEYEKLLRNIFEKPISRKPPIGNPPAYIIDDETNFLRTSNKVKSIHNALVNEKKNSQVFVDDYYDTFITALTDFHIKTEDIQQPPFIDELVLQKMEDLKDLRNDFVNFLETTLTFSAQFDQDKFISFLEKLIDFLLTQEGYSQPNSTHGYLSIDQYRFFYNELFLYLTAIFIEKGKYDDLGVILNTHFVLCNPKNTKTEAYSFMFFNQYTGSLDELRNERLQMRRASVLADQIKQRADIPKYTFDRLRECDALLYYISILRNDKSDNFSWKRWFPQTTVYHIYNISIIEKLASLRYFNKVKPLFDVDSIDELKVKIEKAIEVEADKLERFNHDLPYISHVFDFAKIGTYK